MSPATVLLNKTFTILLESGVLDLKSFVNIHWVTRKKYSWLDFVAVSKPLPNGEKRFRQWQMAIKCRQPNLLSDLRRTVKYYKKDKAKNDNSVDGESDKQPILQDVYRR